MAPSNDPDATAAGAGNRDQSGRDSLAGYLFQILGTAAFRAIASDVQEKDDAVEAHIQLIKTGVVKVESAGQDAELIGRLNGKLIRYWAQFKYSRVTPSKPIAEEELLDIAKKLHDSAVRARDAVEETGYLLVTNRPLSEDAESMVAAARSGAAHAKLTRRKDQKAVLAVLVVQRVNRQAWLDALDTYAARLGTTRPEADRGRFELVGRLVLQTAGSGNVEVDDGLLREVFSGDRAARALSWDELGPFVRDRLERFRHDASVDLRLIRRQVIEEISQSAAQRCLVVVVGEGGRGKSTALYQVLRNVVQGSEPIPVSAFLAGYAPEGGLKEEVARWRNLPPSRDAGGTQDVALERAIVARPDSRPALIVGLDGLDEITDGSRDRLMDLLKFFWDLDRSGGRTGGGKIGPPAVLIVTCRDRKKFLTEWLEGGRGFGYSGPMPAEVLVTDFTPGELLDAARAARVAERHVRGLAVTLSLDDTENLAGGAAVATLATLGIDEPLAKSLLHPAMWRAFLELPPVDQSELFEGSSEAADRLAAKFVEWFCWKTSRRRASPGVGLDREQWEQMLEAVGARFPERPVRALRKAEFTVPAKCDGQFGDGNTNHLYAEAISSGVIEEEQAGSWLWRHDFVRDYLSRRARGGR